MQWLTELGRRLLMLLRRGQFDSDLEEEMRLHRELREQELIERGLSPKEADYAAQRRFGNDLVLREGSRDMWGWNWLENLLQDVRYGLRMLSKYPGFTAVAVLTLALGIGANTAIFTLIHTVMLKSLPVANPTQLHRLGDNDNCCVLTGFQGSFSLFSYRLYEHFRDHTPQFSELAAFQSITMPLSVRRSGASAPAEPFVGEYVSGNYFSMFGLGAFAGRMLTPADDTAGASPVVVMSYRTWQQRFNLDPSVIGASFSIDTAPFSVAGIAPPGFFGDTLRSDPPDFWIPLAAEASLGRKNSLLNDPAQHWLYSIGRLKPDAQPSQVQSQLTVELQQWLSSQADIPTQYREAIPRQHIQLTPAGDGVTTMRDDYMDGLRLLMAVSGLVLLIACANIANLLLARGTTRRQETAMRVALGAPRWRLIRQLLVESVLLSFIGGAAGLYVAYAGTHTILLLAFHGAHFVPINPRPSLPVLGFAFLLSLATGVVFGILPAWVMSHPDPAEALRGEGRSTEDRGSVLRRSFVVLQVAVSFALLVGAGLLTKSLHNLQDQQFGFETRDRYMVRVDPLLAGYTPERLPTLYQQLEQRLTQIPGVLNASLSNYSPMSGSNWGSSIFFEGRPAAANPDDQDSASWVRISPHYFETIGTRLQRGRAIGDQDTPTSRFVAVVNRAFANKFFPHKDAIGEHFGVEDASHSGDYEIVGIVEDTKYVRATEPAWPTFFLPLLQIPRYADETSRSVMIRSSYVNDIEMRVGGKPENLEATVRRTLAEINPNLTVLNLMSLDEQVSRNFNQERLITRLTELFGLLALTLACVGLYGVTSYSVARRISEIGIRMALGATRANVLALVLRGALVQVVLGLAIGVPAALVGGRLLSTQLYGAKSYDPLVLGLAVVTLAVCAFVAGFVPARRSTKVDPMVALRHE